LRIGPESRGFVLLLGALTTLTALAIDMSLPALPTLGREFAASPDRVQLTLSLFIGGYAVGQLFIGPLSDRFGRRPIMLLGLVLYMIATAACTVSPGIGFLIVARLVMGFAGCVGPVLARAVVRDHFAGKTAAQMFSSLTAVFALAPLVAPILGGWLLVHFGWRAIFVFLLAFGLVLALAVAAFFAESLKTPDVQALRPSRLLSNYGAFLGNRICLGYALVNGLCWAGIFAFLSGSPFVFIEIYGVAPSHYGFYFGLSAVALVPGALSNKFLLRRFGSSHVLRAGFAIVTVGGAIIFAACLTRVAGPLGIMAGMMVYIFGQAMVMPNAMAAAMEPVAHMAGSGAALIGVVQMLSGSVAGYAVNALYDGTPTPMGAVILATALGTVAIYWLALRSHRAA
jgi:DHA1 family bicyclomycin/chloramphenicol resistance-like MFS transporter